MTDKSIINDLPFLMSLLFLEFHLLFESKNNID